MKKRLLTFAIFVLTMCISSTNIFAQGDAPGASGDGVGSGGTVDGGVTVGTTAPAQPLSVHFTRNNGDGTCGDKAQIRMYYTTAPTVAPVLTQIYYEGQPLYANFTPVTGNIADFATKGYVSFCLPTQNIPPAIKLTLTYNPSSTQLNATISGTD